MTAYRNMSGQDIPPYYGEYVLPIYAYTIGIELVPNRPSTSPALTYSGWRQFLTQKILSAPDASFTHLTRALSALRVPMNLRRTDFPSAPHPYALAMEQRFQLTIADLYRRAVAMGFFAPSRGGGGWGGGWGGGGGGSYGGGGGTDGSTTKSVADALNSAFQLLNNTMGGGGAGL